MRRRVALLRKSGTAPSFCVVPANAMQMYRTFGLVLSSPLPLPVLLPAEGVADVVGHFDRINLRREPLPGRPCVLATPTEAWFSYPGIGRFRVADGKEIVVDRYDGVDEVALRQ